MIVWPARHLFEAKVPELEPEEEEAFFFHPRCEGIYCNQIGVVYYDELLYNHVATESVSIFRTSTRPHAIVGNKEVVVYECYTGGDWRGRQFYHVNGNPYDYRYDNLIPCIDHTHPKRKEAIFNKGKFCERTLDYLLKLEAKWAKKGVSPKELHEGMGLPSWLIGYRNRKMSKQI